MFYGFRILWSGLSTATAATKLLELFCILDKRKPWFFVLVWNALAPPFFLSGPNGSHWVTVFFVALNNLPIYVFSLKRSVGRPMQFGHLDSV